MRIISFNGITLPDANAEDDLSVNWRSSLLELKGGAFDQDGDEAVLKSRQVSRRVIVVGGTELETDAEVTNLLSSLGKGRGLITVRQRDNVSDLAGWGKIVNVTRQLSVDDYSCRQALTLTWEMDYPYFLHKDDIWFWDDGVILDGSVDFDGHYETIVFTTSGQQATIQNNGGTSVPMGIITVVPRSGASLSNLTILNQANGMGFSWYNTMTYGSILQFDLLGQSVELDGVSDYASIGLASSRQVRWMRLELGDNIITIHGTVTGTVDIYWTWARHYL